MGILCREFYHELISMFLEIISVEQCNISYKMNLAERVTYKFLFGGEYFPDSNRYVINFRALNTKDSLNCFDNILSFIRTYCSIRNEK